MATIIPDTDPDPAPPAAPATAESDPITAPPLAAAEVALRVTRRRRRLVPGAIAVVVVAVAGPVVVALAGHASSSSGARTAVVGGPGIGTTASGVPNAAPGPFSTAPDGFSDALSSAAAHAPTTTAAAGSSPNAPGKPLGPARAASTTRSVRGGGASFTVSVAPTAALGGGVPTLAVALGPSWAWRVAHVEIGAVRLDPPVPHYACNQAAPDPITLTLPGQTFPVGRTDMTVTFTIVSCTPTDTTDGPPTTATVRLPVVVP
jgi:hypothetical protein